MAPKNVFLEAVYKLLLAILTSSFLCHPPLIEMGACSKIIVVLVKNVLFLGGLSILWKQIIYGSNFLLLILYVTLICCASCEHPSKKPKIME